MRLFGTDGIRGVANKGVMSPEIALLLGRAVGLTLSQKVEARRPQVLVGKDTRVSGYLIESAVVAGLCSAGVDVLLAGHTPTPAVAVITQSLHCDMGLMITASHNPFEDNGIKLFDQSGFKVSDEVEENLERLMHTNGVYEHFSQQWSGSVELNEHRPIGRGLGEITSIENAIDLYTKRIKPKNLSLEGLRVVIDCAHGASYRIAPDLLKDLGAEVVAIGVTPDGANINLRCGATYTEELIDTVGRVGADIGIALDGDADRCILVDEQQSVLDGDQILAILGRVMSANKTLKSPCVVATVMSNLGLDATLAKHGVRVERVQVGDRYVVAKMREIGSNLGGEQSGHTILKDFSTTGDGLVTALSILNVMVTEKKTLSELGAEMIRYPQVLKSFKVSSKPSLESLPKTSALISSVEERLGDRGRVLVRYSGTEQKARVMVEGEDQDTVYSLVNKISEVMRSEINSLI